MVGEPSRALPDVDFALGGRDFRGDTGRARADRRRPVQRLPARDLGGARSTSASRAARTRPSTRRRRAGRSSSPPSGAAIVANPYDGIERWFEPGSRAARRRRRRRGGRGVPRAARRPGAGRGAGPPRARARARRAHLPSTARGGCSSCSASEWRRCRLRSTRRAAPADPRLAALRRRRDRAGATTRSGTSAACIDELRAFDPGLEVVVVSDGSTDRTADGRAEAHGAHVAPAAVQPRHRRRRADRLPLRVRGRLRRSPCASTATASTTRRSSARVLAPVLAGEADIAVGSRFAGERRLPLVARRAAIGIRAARLGRLGDRAPARHRHDLRLPGAEPRARSRSSPPTTRTTTRRSRRS